VAREQTIAGDDEAESAQWALEQMDAAGPSPAEAAVLNEILERRLEALADPDLRQIALLRLEGYTNRELAHRFDCTERSIERRLERIRSKWMSYAEGAGSGD
jgi:RNA polymerase sigma factor (sigma-70 family)